MLRGVTSLLLSILLVACGQHAAEQPFDRTLHRFAEQGDSRQLLAAVTAGRKIDERDICYRTPLMLAAQYGRLDTVRQLLAAGARVELHEKGNYTALMLAAGNGHVEVVRTLAAAGAALDVVETTRGWTALIWAANRGHLNTVRLLLELGADASRRDDQGRSARDWARVQQHTEVVALL